jgi:kumamolisin
VVYAARAWEICSLNSRSLPAIAIAAICAYSLLALNSVNADAVKPVFAVPDFVVPDSSIPRADAAAVHTDYVVSTHLIFDAAAAGVPYGVPPELLHAIYNVASDGEGAIAIIDAYDYKLALTDFNFYSKTAGLPQETSGSATSHSNKVLQVVYASGAEPAPNADWNGEEALDIEIAHAMAPKAKIYLVEAANSGLNAMLTAIKLAASLPDVREVSMSWGAREGAGENTMDSSFFTTKGIVYLASSGDSGAGTQYPAASANVIGVGGTTLHFTKGAFTSETGWAGSGGGRSSVESRPAYQNGVKPVVGGARGIPDISADADPDSGVGVYLDGRWWVYGGTSLAAPLCAGIINDAGSPPANSMAELTKIYAHLLTTDFRDITVGNNGFPCLRGYDLVTGVGSPNGAGAF